eukprot:TRINITY_DN13631_c1_g1_i1.p1 TRINITY_DN13631_c1_g1~~TRINITY_DN13631_c1_g1_i1.p1  ORF type:complete len:195 (+),score=43.13 TRINITY_DN13631_c1_g1_i1:66-650(+)
MARPESMTLFQEASFGRIGLSDAAEQRWQQLTGGAHLLENLYRPQPQGNVQELHRRGGATVAHAFPTPELLEQLSQNPDAPPLPESIQRQIYASPFVPPEGEEWHVLHGFLVRMSRAERDRLLARAEASDSEEDEEDEEEDDGIDSEADTSVGSGSVCEFEASERAEASTSNEVERGGDEHAPRQVDEDGVGIL